MLVRVRGSGGSSANSSSIISYRRGAVTNLRAEHWTERPFARWLGVKDETIRPDDTTLSAAAVLARYHPWTVTLDTAGAPRHSLLLELHNTLDILYDEDELVKPGDPLGDAQLSQTPHDVIASLREAKAVQGPPALLPLIAVQGLDSGDVRGSVRFWCISGSNGGWLSMRRLMSMIAFALPHSNPASVLVVIPDECWGTLWHGVVTLFLMSLLYNVRFDNDALRGAPPDILAALSSLLLERNVSFTTFHGQTVTGLLEPSSPLDVCASDDVSMFVRQRLSDLHMSTSAVLNAAPFLRGDELPAFDQSQADAARIADGSLLNFCPCCGHTHKADEPS